MDNDIKHKSREALMAEVQKLREGIRAHRDAKGHNLCWFVPELWGLLPEGYAVHPEYVPPTDEFLTCCATYRRSLTTWVIARNADETEFMLVSKYGWDNTEKLRQDSDERPMTMEHEFQADTAEEANAYYEKFRGWA